METVVERSIEVYKDIATLQAEIRHLQRELSEMEESCKERDATLEKRLRRLELWKLTTDKMAAKWGGILMAASALCTIIATYWEQIRAFLGGSRQ